MLESNKYGPDHLERKNKDPKPISYVKEFGLYSKDSGKFWNGFKQSVTQLSESSLWLQCGEWIRG